MGQRIKKLRDLPKQLGGVEVELNDAVHGSEKLIHFHIHDIRYEMSLSDYLTILSGMIVSEKSLNKLKEKNNE